MSKRLTFEVSDELHSRLKAEAAQLGVSLGSHCAAILGGETSVSPPVEKVDLAALSFYSLDALRELSADIISKKHKGWQQDVANVNAEMRRRFRV